MRIRKTLGQVALASVIGLASCSDIEISKPEDFEKQVIEEVGNISRSVESSNALSKSICKGDREIFQYICRIS